MLYPTDECLHTFIVICIYIYICIHSHVHVISIYYMTIICICVLSRMEMSRTSPFGQVSQDQQVASVMITQHFDCTGNTFKHGSFQRSPSDSPPTPTARSSPLGSVMESFHHIWINVRDPLYFWGCGVPCISVKRILLSP